VGKVTSCSPASRGANTASEILDDRAAPGTAPGKHRPQPLAHAAKLGELCINAGEQGLECGAKLRARRGLGLDRE
jgi:hypothetical protein